MFKTLLSALMVYISTSIDYLFILLVIFTQAKHPKQHQQIYFGQYLGTAILVLLSLATIYFIHFIPEEWMIGLLGIIPILLGARFAIYGEEETEEEEILEKIHNTPHHFLFWTVTLITIASGGDNLGIYIPYFSSLSMSEIITALIVFAICIPILCFISERLSQLPVVSETLERYETYIVPIVFIGLGIYIMVENGTIQYIFQQLS